MIATTAPAAIDRSSAAPSARNVPVRRGPSSVASAPAEADADALPLGVADAVVEGAMLGATEGAAGRVANAVGIATCLLYTSPSPRD